MHQGFEGWQEVSVSINGETDMPMAVELPDVCSVSYLVANLV
jgi:hypothetical protein